MFQSVGGYVRDARTLLQDRIKPFRYSTGSLVSALDVALLEARRVRPDLFLGYLDATPQYYAVIDPNDPEADDWDDDSDDLPTLQEFVPIEEQFRVAILNGLVGHALQRDQEDIEDTRAAAFLDMFYENLTGVKATRNVPKGAPR